MSRLLPDLTNARERSYLETVLKALSLLERNRAMVDIGAYQKGSNADLDRALVLQPKILQFMNQSSGGASRDEAFAALARLCGCKA